MTPAVAVRPVASTESSRLIAPVAALSYPLLLRLGPIGLLPALSMPLVAWVAAYQLGLDGSRPRARRIAHLAFAAPPIFTLLGGLFDFQSKLPLSSFGIWIPLWLFATAIAYYEQPVRRQVEATQSQGLAMAHGFSGLGITLFGLAHLVNHLAGLWSGELHMQITEALRQVYRQPVIEALLLSLIGFQIFSGLVLLTRKLTQPAGGIDTLQTTTATYLTAFFGSHLLAVLGARFAYLENTNWKWLTRQSFLTDPWTIRLLPYYFLVVIVFGVHGAGGVRKVLLARSYSERTGSGVVYACAAISTLVSTLIVIGLLRA